MKKILFALLIALPSFCYSQTPYPGTGSPQGLNYYKGGLRIDSFFKVPERPPTQWDTFGLYSDIIRQDSLLYWFNSADSSYHQIGSDADGLHWSDTLDNIATKSYANTVSVSNIDSLMSYSGKATTLIVKDFLRGGIFNKSDSGTVDSAMTYPRKGGGYWVRDYNKATGVYVTWFGAVHDSITDDTKSIQNAINYVFNQGGGTVFFPFGTYAISSPLRTDSNFNNCQIAIPINASDNNKLSINFVGQSPPAADVGGKTYSRGVHDGAILISTITGSGSFPSVFGGNNSQGQGSYLYTYVNVSFKNLTVAVNPSENGPTVGGIDAYWYMSCTINQVRVRSNTSEFELETEEPTADVFAIRMPHANNNWPIQIINSSVYGFKYGFVLTEQTHANNILARTCKYGLCLQGSGHPIYVDKYTSRLCSYPVMLSAPGVPHGLEAENLRFSITHMDIESSVDTSKWWKHEAIVIDKDNYGIGDISYDNDEEFSGIGTLQYSKIGGVNIRLHPEIFSGDRQIIFNGTATNRESATFGTIQHRQNDSTSDDLYIGLNSFIGAPLGTTSSPMPDDSVLFRKDNLMQTSIRAKFHSGIDSAYFYLLCTKADSLNETKPVKMFGDGTGIFEGAVSARDLIVTGTADSTYSPSLIFPDGHFSDYRQGGFIQFEPYAIPSDSSHARMQFNTEVKGFPATKDSNFVVLAQVKGVATRRIYSLMDQDFTDTTTNAESVNVPIDSTGSDYNYTIFLTAKSAAAVQNGMFYVDSSIHSGGILRFNVSFPNTTTISPGSRYDILVVGIKKEED